MLYEGQKASGELPIVGVNTFLGKDGSPIQVIDEVMRSTDGEKQAQIEDLKNYQSACDAESDAALKQLQESALKGGNVFSSLMDAAKHCSLGQMSRALYQVGGQYRRNM
jgi:methylmalonyl-CoA mutase